MEIFEAMTEIDENSDLHCARLLLLLNAFSGDDGTREVEGMTKLAKLDFLLRYPAMLERALTARSRSAKPVKIQPHEKNNVESKMVRYRYGPWDHRYWEFLRLLRAKGLVRVSRRGLSKIVAITPRGRELAAQLSELPDFRLIAERSKLLKSSLDLTATGIMRFIYDTFPEIGSLELNEEIA